MKTATIDIDQIKETIVPILKEAGVTRSAIFGSYVAGENTKDSDIDILVYINSCSFHIVFIIPKLKLRLFN